MEEIRGLQLKLRRVQARLMAWKVAQRAGISPSMLSMLENERRKLPAELGMRILRVIEQMAKENQT